MKMQKFLPLKGLLLLVLFPFFTHAQPKPFTVDQLSPIYRQTEVRASPALKKLLTEQRQQIQAKKLNFHVANTQVSELRLADITGIRPPTEQERSRATLMMRNYVLNKDAIDIIRKLRLTCNANGKAYDARTAHYVPNIHSQHCGNCWSYSSVGALEISYAKLSSTAPTSIDLSEKQIVACSGAGSCGGGWPYQVYAWLTSSHTKVMNESQDPDNGQNGPCIPVPANAHVQAIGWGLADPGAGLFNIASVEKIKEAICTYGSVSCCLEATPLFQNYAGQGVFTEFTSTTNNPSINHAIVLIGWDDAKQAWLLRNSWGSNWGDGGYAWIGYHTNNIGYGAIWVLSQK